MAKFIPKITPKEKKEVLPKRYNQRTYNRLFLGGAATFVLLSGGAMATNIVRMNAQPKEVAVVQEDGKEQMTVDYRLQNWANNFAYYYFNFPSDSDEQSKNIEKLNSFYATIMDVKNRSHVRQPSRLNSIKLLDVTDKEVRYLVSYTVNPGTDQKVDMVTDFVVPYSVKADKYYVSDLPYFVTPEDSQLVKLEDKEALRLTPSTELEKEEQEKLDDFVKLFFVNYTSSQENLDLVSKDIKMLLGHELQSLDFTSYSKTKDKIKAYAQVTFKSADRNTRSENFTLELKEKGESYEVTKMTHGIK